MSWANFDDGYTDHPKVVGLSDGAFRLHTSGIIYCSRYLTNGFIPKPQVGRLTPNYRSSHVTELTKAGLWSSSGGGFIIHDYLQWNRSREEIAAERQAKSKAGKAGAEARWGRRGR